MHAFREISKFGRSGIVCGLLLLGVAELSGTAPTALAQTSDEALRELTRAFSAGDADRLTAMSTARIDLSIPGSNSEYSRRQATLLLRSFFRKFPPESFEIRDFTKTGRGWFIEAGYRVRDRSSPMRIYVRLRLGETGWLVREIMIRESRE